MMHSKRMPESAEPRMLAVSLFRHCLDRGVTVEDALAATPDMARLSPRDRALVSTILLTAFRHLGEINAILAGLMSKPLPRKSGPAGDILRLGIAQLVFLEMPPHAVIDLSVRAAKAERNATHFAGLVNAVLRKAAVQGLPLRAGLDAGQLNTPAWLWSRWSRNYGADMAHRIAEAHTDRPSLDLSFRDKPDTWVGELGGKLLPNGQIRLAPGHQPVPELPGFSEGAWWVQDAAASLPVRLFGDVAGRRVLDLCAAPGGKTLQLAALGAEVTSVDASASRLERLRANLTRTRLAAEIRTEDVLEGTLSGTWDMALLDAPCSATGTIRRHPELPWLKREAQISELAALQARLLERASQLVAPGGLLVYCTCSLEPEEGEERIRAFLASDARFSTVRASVAWLPPEAVGAEGWVRTLPDMQIGGSRGMDGFFVALLRRRA